MSRPAKSFIGLRFGKLVVVEELPTIIQPAGGHCRLFKCLCDCGNYTNVKYPHLVQNSIKSCGCGKYNKYGLTNLSKNPKYRRLYCIFIDMHYRCENPNHSSYRYYGERGITICEEWNQFMPFFDWAINNGYSDELTIDRIDVNGNYEPSNCRWATPLQQARNTRFSKKLEHNGIVKPIGDWADELGIKIGTIRSRLQRHPDAPSSEILRPVR